MLFFGQAVTYRKEMNTVATPLRPAGETLVLCSSWSSTTKGCVWWSLHREPTEEAGNWLNLLKSQMRGSVHREAVSFDQSLLA